MEFDAPDTSIPGERTVGAEALLMGEGQEPSFSLTEIDHYAALLSRSGRGEEYL